MLEQTAFGTNNFAENPEPRVPVVLLLDVSGSMNGPPIEQLNAGVLTFKDAVVADSLAAKRVEIAIVSFGGDQVQTVCDFTTVEGFHPPTLTCGGLTPMVAAIRQGIDMIEQRKSVYKTHAISYYRPWLFLITDGAPNPTDDWKSVALQVKQKEEAKAFMFFAVGVEGANFDILKQIAVREPLKLKGLRFQELFLWLSSSLSSVSRSSPDQAVALTDPTKGPSGWATTA
jgi:uncharacterized protein YegL